MKLLIALMVVGMSVSAVAKPAKVAALPAKVEKTDLPAEAQEVLAETQGETAVAAVTETGAKTEAATEAKAEVIDVKKAAENEIPLHLEGKSASSEGGGAWARISLGFLVLAALIGGAWFGLRRMSRPDQRKSGPQIKVLNQHWLGPKKSLAIIRVAGESILIGITDDNINHIKTLSLLDEEIPVETPDRFTHVLDDVGLKGQDIEEADGEEFQMSGLNQIKDTVSRRLKGMRTLE